MDNDVILFNGSLLCSKESKMLVPYIPEAKFRITWFDIIFFSLVFIVYGFYFLLLALFLNILK